ncbi:VOC family protein [Pantoea sp. MBD-2R]|uniref:VOC family protein n=1 Tax=Pantoea sp. MBD-2R TaxID=3141540 RepID=UPI003183B6F7
MSALAPVLDHAVINVADRLDEAATLFRRLGFQLTARGNHSLGSSNHLAVLGENYLELLGYEPGAADLRKAIWTSPPGLNGLVWKTQNADEVWQHLRERGLESDQPEQFYRPVTLPDGQEKQARFCTVRLKNGAVANGRSFFCQHLTPDAVWQHAWQRHPNGAANITDFVIAASDPFFAAEVYSQLFGAEWIKRTEGGAELAAGVARVRFLKPEAVLAEYGSLPGDFDGSPRMAALGIRTTSAERLRVSLMAGDIPFTPVNGACQVKAEHAFNLALRFWC